MRLQLAASPVKLLRTLVWLRLLAVVGQSITVFVVSHWLLIALPVTSMAVVIAVLGSTAILLAGRLRLTWPVTELEVGLQLCVDVAALTMLLFLSGGTTNPFGSLYLIPVVLSAVGLSWRYTAALALLSAACYAWLMDHFTPLAFTQGEAGAFNLHILGMGVNFAVSLLILAVVAAALAHEIRRRDRVVATLREETLRQEHLNAMGLLAAGAAHELSTPLFAISLLASELSLVRRIDAKAKDDLALLSQQVQICKEKLTVLLQAADQSRSPSLRRAELRELIQRVLDNWRIVRPAAKLDVVWGAGCDGAELIVDEGFAQALTSILDNAADAGRTNGSEHVSVTVKLDSGTVCICVDDDGQGLSAEARQHAGEARFSTKPDGFGIGLVLSHANLNRLGGELTLVDRFGGGTRTTIAIPAAGSGHSA